MESFLLCYLSLLLSLSPPLQNTGLGEKDHFSQESHDCTDNFVIDIVAAGSLENGDREKTIKYNSFFFRKGVQFTNPILGAFKRSLTPKVNW